MLSCKYMIISLEIFTILQIYIEKSENGLKKNICFIGKTVISNKLGNKSGYKTLISNYQKIKSELGFHLEHCFSLAPFCLSHIMYMVCSAHLSFSFQVIKMYVVHIPILCIQLGFGFLPDFYFKI